MGLAKAGGAEVAVHKRPQTVSAFSNGGYSVGTAKKTQTFREDGTKMTPVEARKWRREVARQQEIDGLSARVAKGDGVGSSGDESGGYAAYMRVKNQKTAKATEVAQQVQQPEPQLSEEVREILGFFEGREVNSRDADSLRYLANGETLSKARMGDLESVLEVHKAYRGPGFQQATPQQRVEDAWKGDVPTSAQLSYLARLSEMSRAEVDHVYGKLTKGEVSNEISRLKSLLYGDS